jgi:HAD superfamily hydrolase (TIGR01509 family)
MAARKNLLQLFYAPAQDTSMPTPRFVLFDWDNTLHDSAGTNFAALARVLSGYGLHVSPESYRRAYTVDYRRLYRDLGLAEERIEEASGRWRSLVAGAQPRLLPGAASALDILVEEGARLALVTSAPRAIVEPQLRALGLTGLFAVAIFGEAQPPRPDPAPLLAALRELGARPGDATYCSDTSADMRMGRAAGVHAIGISSFAFGPAMLCAGGAEATAPSVAAWVDGRGIACDG